MLIAELQGLLQRVIIPNLEQLWEVTEDEAVQERIELLIHRVHFSDLQQALSDHASDRLTFFAFDLMYLDGFDLTKVRLDQRRSGVIGGAENDRLIVADGVEVENSVRSRHQEQRAMIRAAKPIRSIVAETGR